jgi:UrcA family protein
MSTKEKPMTSTTLNLGVRLRSATVIAVLAACTALGAVGSAHAGTAAVAALKVRYSDLNLATEQGSLALYGRIVAAANRVCAPDDIRDLQAVADARLCRAEAIARAVHDVNSPQLASVYAERARHG